MTDLRGAFRMVNLELGGSLVGNALDVVLPRLLFLSLEGDGLLTRKGSHRVRVQM